MIPIYFDDNQCPLCNGYIQNYDRYGRITNNGICFCKCDTCGAEFLLRQVENSTKLQYRDKMDSIHYFFDRYL